ncbi:DoxX family membrane protein [Suttonella sp. R2A3]|uniref:TQO small subunit DoxD n=1 Tax=Suttonella sp. R2A3 TaxID=2908648 RepID=UPI001F18D40A|nr:TQO small subunit DoxD [Suttonella sp. R2A3]UJF25410.1 DoxX family membrane protein [Suttonella sp. R2A3]
MYRDSINFAKRELAVRAISITMGFVFFIAGWRRFYNMPAKHDIESAAHLANKLVAAAPGSPIEGIIHWIMYQPSLLSLSTYLFSTAELVVGLCLMIGLFTRLAAIGSMGLQIVLMVIFGWMGYECLDEWTMAATGFAISVAIFLIGSGSYSLDSLMDKDILARWATPKVSGVLVVLATVITIGFYSFYFGIFHFEKRTSTHNYSIVAEVVEGQSDVRTLYVKAGGSSTASYVKGITFTLPDGSIVEQSPEEIEVVRQHFLPWSKSGKVVDGVLKLRLGSKTDIRIPAGATSAVIDLIDNKDQELTFTE